MAALLHELQTKDVGEKVQLICLYAEHHPQYAEIPLLSLVDEPDGALRSAVECCQKLVRAERVPARLKAAALKILGKLEVPVAEEVASGLFTGSNEDALQVAIVKYWEAMGAQLSPATIQQVKNTAVDEEYANRIVALTSK